MANWQANAVLLCQLVSFARMRVFRCQVSSRQGWKTTTLFVRADLLAGKSMIGAGSEQHVSESRHYLDISSCVSMNCPLGLYRYMCASLETAELILTTSKQQSTGMLRHSYSERALQASSSAVSPLSGGCCSYAFQPLLHYPRLLPVLPVLHCNTGAGRKS